MSTGKSDEAIQVGEWIVDAAIDTISRGGETVKLEPRTMRLLICLVDSAGAVVSIERLLSEVWAGVVVGSASVYQAVSQLRKILGDTDPEPTYIATVPRKGYRLVAPVRRGAVPAPGAGAASRAGAALPSGSGAAPGVGAASGAVAALQPEFDAALQPGTSAASPDSAPGVKRRLTAIALGGLAAVALIAVAWMPLRSLFVSDVAAASIVVLPFVDMTADKHDQPFCDGLTEELSNWLAQIPALRVVARTSAFSFRGQDQDVRKIGKALDTNHILEGSMRRSGDHMRVTVQLIDARNGYHLWSANYDRPMDDTIKMQEDISRSVAETLEIRLTADTSQRFAERRSTNPAAYQWYLLARHYQQERTGASNDRAIELYRQVLTADPKFALAYTGLAYALLNQNWLADRPINEIAAEAEPLLNTALSLDAGLPEIYAVRGALRAEQFRNDAALHDLDRAVTLNPNDSAAFAELGRLYLGNLGQPRDALINFIQAGDLDPLNFMPPAQRCVALQDLARFEEAAAACARARALQPQGYWPFTVTSWLASAQGRLDEALHWNDLALKAAPDIFELYRERATYFLTLGLAPRARDTLVAARTATHDEEAVNDEMAPVAYYEGGPAALRAHLAATRLETSVHAGRLLSAAYYRLLVGDSAEARGLVERARQAADFVPEALQSPWDLARWGHSDDLTIALVELRGGDRASAYRRLDTLAATLDQLARNGEQRYGVDELRATVLAQRGEADGAMKSLARAAEKGWRRAWWAAREPDVAALWARGDFRDLVTRVGSSNAKLRESVQQRYR
jgi:TolB-like protein/DNA-binding winged helix-turn-helix (wHTH) protein